MHMISFILIYVLVYNFVYSENDVFLETIGFNGSFSSVREISTGYVASGTTLYDDDVHNVMLARFDPEGNPLWIKSIGNEYKHEFVHQMEPLSDGEGFVITGLVTDEVDEEEMFIMIIDNNGEDTYTATFGRESLGYFEEGISVKEMSDGNFIVVGNVRASTLPSSLLLVLFADNQSFGSLVTEFQKTYTVPASNGDFGKAVIDLPEGGFLVGGNSQSFFPDVLRMLLFETNDAGEFQRGNTIGSGSSDIMDLSMECLEKSTTDTTFISCGYSDPNDGSGNGNAVVIKFSSDGSVLFSAEYYGDSSDDGEERCASIYPIDDDGYIFCGYMTYVEDFFLETHKYILLARIGGSTGNLVWARRIGQLNIDTACDSVRTTSDGYIVVAGHSKFFNEEEESFEEGVFFKVDSENGEFCVGSQTGSENEDQTGDWLNARFDLTFEPFSPEVTRLDGIMESPLSTSYVMGELVTETVDIVGRNRTVCRNCSNGYVKKGEDGQCVSIDDDDDTDDDNNNDDSGDDLDDEKETTPQFDALITIFPTLFFICFVCTCFCCCCCFCCFVMIILLLTGGGTSSVGICSILLFFYDFKKKYERFRSDSQLHQNLLQDTETEQIASININKSLLEIKSRHIEIERLIGKGGSGAVVYLAKWKEKLVAYKCFRTMGLFDTKQDFSEFEREIGVMGSIHHPYILSFYGCTLKPPRVGIVMEYCSNGDMKRFQEVNPEYPISEKIRILGHEYLHDRNVIHRDVKPENILINDQEEPKITDFGVSKVYEKMTVNKTKQVGTSFYMAPEMVKGDMDGYSTKCDVFSFGVVIWVSLTNNFLPYGENMFGIEYKVANDQNFRPDLLEIPEDVRERYGDVVDVISLCWGEDPFKRPDFGQLKKLFYDCISSHENEKTVK